MRESLVPTDLTLCCVVSTDSTTETSRPAVEGRCWYGEHELIDHDAQLWRQFVEHERLSRLLLRRSRLCHDRSSSDRIMLRVALLTLAKMRIVLVVQLVLSSKWPVHLHVKQQ